MFCSHFFQSKGGECLIPQRFRITLEMGSTDGTFRTNTEV